MLPKKARNLAYGLGARGDRHQPPGEQQEADRVAHAEMRWAIDIIMVSIGR